MVSNKFIYALDSIKEYVEAFTFLGTVLLTSIDEKQWAFACTRDWDGFMRYLSSIEQDTTYNYFARNHLSLLRFREAPSYVQLRVLQVRPTLLKEYRVRDCLRESMRNREEEFQDVFHKTFIKIITRDDENEVKFDYNLYVRYITNQKKE